MLASCLADACGGQGQGAGDESHRAFFPGREESGEQVSVTQEG